MATNEQQAPGNPPDSYLQVAVNQVRSIPLPDGDSGEGLALVSDRGEVQAIRHAAPGSQKAVIWVCGARGGFGGPGPGLYAQLAQQFTQQGITSLRLDYRLPNVLPECALDLLAGVACLEDSGHDPVVIVGHSFGGAVVIAAGAVSRHVAGVVSLSPQTYGANMAGLLSPRPLLIVHGKADTRLPYSLRHANPPVGPGTQAVSPVRWGRTPPGRVPGRTGRPPDRLDTGNPQRKANRKVTHHQQTRRSRAGGNLDPAVN